MILVMFRLISLLAFGSMSHRSEERTSLVDLTALNPRPTWLHGKSLQRPIRHPATEVKNAPALPRLRCASMAFAQRLFLSSPLRGPCSVARIVVLAAAAHRFLLGRPCLRQLPALCLESRLFALTMGRGHPESVRPVEGNPKTITYSTSCTHLQIGREHGRPQHGLRIGR